MPKNPRVLLVEDQPELGHVLRDLLKGEGYDVVAVTSPREAFGILRDEEIQLLVTDLRNGPENSVSLDTMTAEFPKLRHIDLIDEASATVPFFGPWRVSGLRMTLPKPIRIDDLIRASRTLTERP